MTALHQKFHPRRVRRVAGAATCVQDPLAFALAELRETPTVATHRLRRSGLLAEIRHPLLDLWVIEEVFRFRVYQPPAPVLAALGKLQGPIRILDLGGHVGLFGLFALGLAPDSSIVSFEPDPRNLAILRRCIAVNQLAARWEVVPACAATDDGTVEFASSFHLSRMSQASDQSLSAFQEQLADVFPFLAETALLQPREVLVERRDALPYFGQSDLVKIDIEGAEWELLADPRLAQSGATAMVIEYHPAYLHGADPEATVTSLLAAAGYRTTTPRRRDDAGLIWAWRPAAGDTA